MIAITGATGQLGRKVVAAFKRAHPATPVVAVVRDPAKAADLGVETRAADYGDLAALRAAFEGVETLLLISSNSFSDRAEHHSNAIEAAKAAGVARIVYTSILHADQLEVALASDHKATEARLRDSGLAFTILRNGWYWENHTASLGQALQHGVLAGAAGEGRIAWASRQDFAEAAVAVLTGAGHEGRIYELAGDTAHTLSELAAETSRQSGKPLEYRHFDEAGLKGFYQSVGLPETFSAILAEVEARALGGGQMDDDSRTLSGLIGRPTTPLDQAVAEALRG